MLKKEKAVNKTPAVQTKDQLFYIEDYSTFMRELSLGQFYKEVAHLEK